MLLNKNSNTSSLKLLSPAEASSYLGVTTETLAVWRCTKRYNLRFYKIGRLVKYRKEDLEAFIQSRARNYREVRHG